jgi:hypothetical protein
VKIGFTTRNPHTRAAELGNVTGVPGKFEILHIFPVTNGRKAETLVFSILSEKRIENKEFFKISADAAFVEIQRILKISGLAHSGSDNGIYDFVHYLIKLSDPNSLNFNSVDQTKKRVGDFVDLFLQLLKLKDTTKIVDFYRDQIKDVDEKIDDLPITLSDFLLIFDLFMSGYATYMERIVNISGFSPIKPNNPELIKAASNAIFLNKNRSNFNYNEIAKYYCKSLTTQRDLASKYVNDLRSFQKKNNIDWVPLALDHQTVDFKKVLPAPEFNNHILKRFGFKHFNLTGKLGEGQVNIIAPQNGTAAIFNGEPYSCELITGLEYKFLLKNVNTQGWFYNWEKSKESRSILIVINEGRVIYLAGRESLIGNSKGIIRVAYDF